MASELKPTPETIDSVCLSYRHDFGLLDEASKRPIRSEALWWFEAWQKEGYFVTRPAPAATDTGLETVAWQRQSSFYSDGWGPVDAGHAQKLAEAGELVRELVTRSQAEELSAAERDKVIVQTKRAELAELKERWLKEMVAAITSNPIGSPKHFRAVEDARRALNNPEASLYALYEKEELIQRVEKAEADNAALTARSKELEANTDTLMTECHRVSKESGDQFREMRAQVEALEAKLATAVKLMGEARETREALEVKLAAAEDGVRYALTNLRMNKSDEAFLAAVLGRKPS